MLYIYHIIYYNYIYIYYICFKQCYIVLYYIISETTIYYNISRTWCLDLSRWLVGFQTAGITSEAAAEYAAMEAPKVIVTGFFQNNSHPPTCCRITPDGCFFWRPRYLSVFPCVLNWWWASNLRSRSNRLYSFLTGGCGSSRGWQTGLDLYIYIIYHIFHCFEYCILYLTNHNVYYTYIMKHALYFTDYIFFIYVHIIDIFRNYILLWYDLVNFDIIYYHTL